MSFFPYIDNNFYYGFIPIPRNCSKPPTIYSILESIVNFGKEEKTKIKDLAKVGHSKIFDFEYPLSDKINKDEFEILILNHYLTRRINFDTPNLFKIQLNVKLNEIMPLYNKMFNAIDNWDIFKDGEKTSRFGNDDRKIDSSSDTTNILNNTSNSTNISDRRESNTPQNKLENVRDGSYVTKYNYDQSNSKDDSNSNGTSKNISNTLDKNNYSETIEKTNANKIEILKQIQTEIKSIYTLIFDELDDLFYSVL